MIGGPGVAYNINNDRSVFPTSQRPNGGDMMLGAAEHGLPVDFFTFHDVNPCLYLPVCNVTDVSSLLAHAKSIQGDYCSFLDKADSIQRCEFYGFRSLTKSDAAYHAFKYIKSINPRGQSFLQFLTVS